MANMFPESSATADVAEVDWLDFVRKRLKEGVASRAVVCGRNRASRLHHRRWHEDEPRLMIDDQLIGQAHVRITNVLLHVCNKHG